MALRVTDWEYYRKIDEDDPFIDGYQVKLTIWSGNCGKDNTSTGNLDLDSYTNGGSDFRDIAFGDGSDPSSCNELDYWIESTGTDSGDDYAVVWVELNSTVASNNSFYVFYESDTATDYSNGDNTFIFFDDFSGSSLDTSSTWTVLNAGTNRSYDVSNSILQIDNNYFHTNYGIRTQSSFNDTNIILESRTRVDTQEHTSDQNCGTSMENSTSLPPSEDDGSRVRALDNYWEHHYYVNSTQSDVLISNNDPSTDWHIARISKLDDIFKGEVLQDDYTSEGSDTQTISDLASSFYIYLWIRDSGGHAVTDYDWVRLREYNSTEPSYGTFNSETELGGATTYDVSTISSITLYETGTSSTVSSITLQTSETSETVSSITLQIQNNEVYTPSSLTLKTSGELETPSSITLQKTETISTPTSITIETTTTPGTPTSITLQKTETVSTVSSIITYAPGEITTPTSITLQKLGNTKETPSSITLQITNNTIETLSSITLHETYTLSTISSITLETSPTIETDTSITLQTQDNGTSVNSSITIYETYTTTSPTSIKLKTTPTLETPTSITTKTLNNTLETPTSITLEGATTKTIPTSITLQTSHTLTTPTSITTAGTNTTTTISSITLQKTETTSTVSSISTTNTYTTETISSITLTKTYWRCATSDNLDSHSGSDSGKTLAEALDATDNWNDSSDHTHWFILDLGTLHKIEKFKSFSNAQISGYAADPTNIDIYISTDGETWGTAVAEDISTWQDTNSYIEVDSTDKTGRYIKVQINSTEYPIFDFLAWGSTSRPGSIFCFYGTPTTTQTQTVNTSIHTKKTQTKNTPTSITIKSEGNTLETVSSITLQTSHTLTTPSSIHIVSAGTLNTPTSITLQTTSTLDTNSSISLSGTNTQTTTTSISIYETYTTTTNSSITLSGLNTTTTPASITTKTHKNPVTTPSSITIVNTYTLETNTSITLQTTLAPAVTTSITLETTGTLTTSSSINLYDNAEITVRRKTPVLDFDGNDYITISDADIFDITDTITLEIEINPDINNTSIKNLIDKNTAYRLTLGDGGTQNYPIFQAYISGAWRSVTLGETIPTGTWSHITGTYSSTTQTLSIYLDGVLKNTTVLNGLGNYTINSNSNDIHIGYEFDGQIKYARIYDTCLTSGQVKRNSQGNINYNDLVAWYDMTECTGTSTFNKKNQGWNTGTITGATWGYTTDTLNISSWTITRNTGNTLDTGQFLLSPTYMDYKTGDEIQLYNNTTSTVIWGGYIQHRGRINSDGLVTLEALGYGSDLINKKVVLDETSKSPEYILSQALTYTGGENNRGRTYTISTPVASGITIANYSMQDSLTRTFGEMIDRTGYTFRWIPGGTVYFEPIGNSDSGYTLDSSTIGTIFEEWIQDNPESIINRVAVNGEGLVDGEWENYSGEYSHTPNISMYGEHYLHIKVDYLSSDSEADALAEQLVRVDPSPGGTITFPWSHIDWGDIVNHTITIIDELRQINGSYTVYTQTISSDGTCKIVVGKNPDTPWIDRARERNAIGAERARLFMSTSGTQYGNVSGSTAGYNLGTGGSIGGYSLGAGASTSDENLGAGAYTSDETLGGTGQVNSANSNHIHTIGDSVLKYNHGHGVWNETSSGPLGDSGDPCPYHYHNVNITVGSTSATKLFINDHTVYCKYSTEGTHPHTSHSITPSPTDHNHPATAWVSPTDHDHPATAWVSPTDHDHTPYITVDPGSHPHDIDIEEGVTIDVTVPDLGKSDR